MSRSISSGPARQWSRRRVLQGAAATVGLAAAATTLSTRAQATPDTAAAGVTLKILVNQPHLSAYTNFLAPAWAQLTGGTLVATATDYTDLTAAMIADVRTGTGTYDLFDYFYYGIGALVAADALVDLTAWIASQPGIDTADFLPAIHDPYTLYQRRRYGLPFDGDQHLLFYNAEILAAYGLQPPATWDEYQAAAKTITQGSGGATYGAIVQGLPDPLALGCAFINRLVGYGGDLVNAAGRPVLTSHAALAAAQRLIDIAPYALPTPLRIGLDTGPAAFLSGQGAMIETWTGMAHEAENPALSKIAGKWGVVPLPLGAATIPRRTPLNTGYGIGVSPLSKNTATALAYVKWVTGAAEALAATTAANSPIDPNRTSVLNSAAYAAATPVAVDAIRAGLDGTPMVWPRDRNAQTNLQNLANQLALAIGGQQDAATALRNAQKEWI